ncbi:sigma-70 family RNA polymerase sigma factor [Brevibacterium sp.]|uniref:RNA polymerase sigma factor n=1 Tax=Brevibacterium sp. TaxID=1701 RepID=UPI002811F40D|nr:sigma-70 family RNA polymerase sigma factor [Brevibacterium sp.]
MIEAIFREEWGRLVASLCRVLGDFDLAEDAAQGAFEAAARHWPRDGVPDNPRAWLLTTARRKAIDELRRVKRLTVGVSEARLDSESELTKGDVQIALHSEQPTVPDGRLELIFACCHPALAREAQVALVLRSLVGMSTAEIARAFLVSEETMKRRLTRAKTKLRTAGIPFEQPRSEDLDTRLEAVLSVIYLLFNAGYAGRGDLADRAIWFARVMTALLPHVSKIHGLLALMLFHESRRDARVIDGAFVPLPEQDRARWDYRMIDEAKERLERALSSRESSTYTIQAQIAAEHCREVVDWHRIVALYTDLQQLLDSDIVTLNKAIAVAHTESPDSALQMIEDLNLPNYHYLHSTRGELLHHLGRTAEARAEFNLARELADSELDRTFLAKRLQQLPDVRGDNPHIDKGDVI